MTIITAERQRNRTEATTTDSERETNARTHRTSRSPRRRHRSVSDNPEELLHLFLEAAKKLWSYIKQASTFIMIELGGYQAFDQIVKWCVRNPNISICLSAVIAMMLLPFLIFLGFGISTIVVTFTGLLILEGTLLTILSMCLFGCLAALSVVLIFFAIFGVAAYFGFNHIYDIYGGAERHTTSLMNLQNERSRSASAGDSGGADLGNAHRSENVENNLQ